MTIGVSAMVIAVLPLLLHFFGTVWHAGVRPKAGNYFRAVPK
jgi:hypothetical protein